MKEVKIVEYHSAYDAPKEAKQHAEQLLTQLLNSGWEIKAGGGGYARVAIILVRE